MYDYINPYKADNLIRIFFVYKQIRVKSSRENNGKKLTKKELENNKEEDIVIQIDGKDHCRICRYTWIKKPNWGSHTNTDRHKKAKDKLLKAYETKKTMVSGRKRKRNDVNDERKIDSDDDQDAQGVEAKKRKIDD